MDNIPSWELISGATWKSPLGPGSDIEGKGHYPVVHVSLKIQRPMPCGANKNTHRNRVGIRGEFGLIDSKDQMSGAYDREENLLRILGKGYSLHLTQAKTAFLTLLQVAVINPAK